MFFSKTGKIKKQCIFAMFAIISIANISATGTRVSQNAVISTYQGTNGPWQYLELLFITKPEAELKKFIEQYFVAPLGVVGASVLAKISFFDNSVNLPITKIPADPTTVEAKFITVKNSQIKNIVMIASALAAGKTIYNFIEGQAKRSIQKKALFNILKKWNLYREHFPASLVEYFDELESEFTLHCFTLSNNVISDVFQLIEHHIEHHFESRYKKAEAKPTNHIETFKTCTDVWKNLE